MLTPLRQAVQAQFAQAETLRRPALRRTDAPDALLMCDLPRIAPAADVAAFIAALEAQGWRVRQEPGWLMLDHDVPVPEWTWPDCYAGEWGCCVWLLRHHGGDEAPERHIRALVKAQEQGKERVEWLCRQWHGEFAARLREHRKLPGGLAPYLCAAMKEETR